jgi:2-polyprenyl-3-methyl-5-hydroxy-6-metoxy-1,4-benzoquinol methylase
VYDLDNSPRARRIIQVVSDLCRGDFRERRLLDLGCAHGHYAIEFARRGAEAVGIEGRASWLEQANESKARLGLSNARFIEDDVRGISRAQHGAFDVILCLGLLYHLDFEDALGLLRSMADMCTDFVVIDTQIAVRPDTVRTFEGRSYSGWVYREHPEGATREQKAATLGASLDDDLSFWFTKRSLLNALRHAGFTSVMECRNPLDNMYLNGEFKLHEDVVTLVAMKGQDVDFLDSNANGHEQEDWPESSEGLYLERPWSVRPAPSLLGRLKFWRR